MQLLMEMCYKIYWDHDEQLQETEPTARGSGRIWQYWPLNFLGEERKRLVLKIAGSRRGKPEKERKNKMNCKYEAQSFDWEMTAFKHSHLKCSHCPESKLLNIHFSLFFCKMCRTYLSYEERLNTCVSIC